MTIKRTLKQQAAIDKAFQTYKAIQNVIQLQNHGQIGWRDGKQILKDLETRINRELDEYNEAVCEEIMKQ